MEALKGVRQSEPKQRLEGRLFLKREEPAPVYALPASNERPDVTEELNDVQRFEVHLYASRNLWDIERRRSGLHIGERKIGREEAAQLLRVSLRALEGGAE
jgi:hypothetical protein